MIIEKVPPSKSNTENIKSKTNMKYECISGLKIIVPISSMISFTSALLFNFNSSKENPISFVFGLEL